MKLDPRWIVFDLADRNNGDLMVHSIAGVPCQKSLRRAVKSGLLGLDRDGYQAVAEFAQTRRYSGSVPHAEHHVVEHPEYGPTAIAIWLHPSPPVERPVLNSWVLDLDELTTVTAGDDVSLMADGRSPGEERPIQDLWKFLKPTDAAALVTRYQQAISDPDNTWESIEWTLTLPDSPPLHMFSGGRLRIDGDRRVIVGTSIVLQERTQQTRDLVSDLVGFSAITLAIVNRQARTAVTTVGTDAPLSYEALKTLVTEYDLYATGTFPVTLDNNAYEAQVVPIADPDDGPATVMLRRTGVR
jgi:hypothetical protein